MKKSKDVLELSWVKNPGIFCPDQNKILKFSPKKILKFHDKLGFLEFSGPTIFLPAMFCLEIFCPGILFHGKYMDSAAAAETVSLDHAAARVVLKVTKKLGNKSWLQNDYING